jgi:hypothetical protein
MHKFYVRATDGAVPSVKFEFLNWHKIKIYTDEMSLRILSNTLKIIDRIRQIKFM